MTIRVSHEIADYIERLAKERNESRGRVVEDSIREGQTSWEKGFYDEELNNLSNKMGIGVLSILQMIDYMVEHRILQRNAEGSYVVKGKPLDPEYISVDEVIDGLNTSEKQKSFMKREILSNIGAMKEQSVGTSDWA